MDMQLSIKTFAVSANFLQLVGLKVVDANDLSIFREAGSPSNPKMVLLHGFPASSHQYHNLISTPADHFHVVAPDYPGFEGRLVTIQNNPVLIAP